MHCGSQLRLAVEYVLTYVIFAHKGSTFPRYSSSLLPRSSSHLLTTHKSLLQMTIQSLETGTRESTKVVTRLRRGLCAHRHRHVTSAIDLATHLRHKLFFSIATVLPVFVPASSSAWSKHVNCLSMAHDQSLTTYNRSSTDVRSSPPRALQALPLQGLHPDSIVPSPQRFLLVLITLSFVFYGGHHSSSSTLSSGAAIGRR